MNRKQRRAAAKLDPPATKNYAEARSDLGLALAAQGKLDEAVAAYRQAIGIKSNYAEAHSNLGLALAAQSKLDEAVAAYRPAVRIKAHHAEAPFQPRGAPGVPSQLD